MVGGRVGDDRLSFDCPGGGVKGVSVDGEIVYNTEFRNIICRNQECCYVGQPKTGKIDTTHGYALYCPQCGIFSGWGGRKKSLHSANGERKLSTQWPPKRLGIDFCQICLRTDDQLGDGECLESHHVIPVKDGGKDSPSNIWVCCTGCHKEIHHRRTYLNLHLSKFYEAYAYLNGHGAYVKPQP